MSSVPPSTTRAALLFIGFGLLIAAGSVGVLVYLVARGPLPDGARAVLGVIALGGVLVAVVGGIATDGNRFGLAFDRVERTVASVLPPGVCRAEPVPGTLLDRPAAPPAFVPDVGPPAEVREGDAPGQALAGIAERAKRRQPRRAAVTRDAARPDVPVRPPRLVRDRSGDTLTAEERAELRAWLAERRRRESDAPGPPEGAA